MNVVLALLLTNAVLGAWDTLWYHEYRTRLTARIEHTSIELRLHAARDGVYVILYGVLAWWVPTGAAVGVIVVLLVAEIGITLADFVVEDRDRPAIGGIPAGERMLHSVMAIVYGAMLVQLAPVLAGGAGAPTSFARHAASLPLSLAASIAALGIAMSGLRDVAAVRGHDPIWPQIATSAPGASVARGADVARQSHFGE